LRGEIKARGGGDAVTSLTTINAEIGWAFGPRSRNPHAAGLLRRPRSLRVPAARKHLLCWRSSTMAPHRLRRAALHLLPRRSERGLLYFYRGLLCSRSLESRQLSAGRTKPKSSSRISSRDRSGCRSASSPRRRSSRGRSSISTGGYDFTASRRLGVVS
jgi:hypothetical protein